MKALVITLGLLVSAVSLAGSETSQSALKERVAKEMAKRLPKGVVVTVDRVSAQGEIHADAEMVSVSPEPPIGLVSFQFLDKRGVARFGNAVIRATGDVAVAKRPIQHGEAFSADNISFQRREISTLAHSGYFVELSELKGLRSQGYIRPGIVLSAQNARVEFAVLQGQQVDLIHKVGSLVVSARVKALQSGVLGEWITVVNNDSKKIMQARVRAKGEVETR